MRGKVFPVIGLSVLLLAVLVTGYMPEVSIDALDTEYFRADTYLIRDNSFREEKYLSVPDYECEGDRNVGRGDFQRILSEMEKNSACAERVLCLSRVIVNERFLREKGMEFVTLNQGLFASRSLPAAADFFNSYTNLTDLSRLHTQIVQRK